ncbi:MAG: hypothetical protein L3J91_01865 [Thermoplasmata archaeon]|nr:hypothetical protein [Thermoplasmata archaeon]
MTILPAARKAGLTIHNADPSEYQFLERSRDRLEKAGFGVMRNCIRWKRTGEPPWDAVDDLLGRPAQSVAR